MAPSIPDKMKAAALDRFGGPEVLGIKTVPVPTCGDDEILIRVEGAGVGVWDSLEREGEMAGMMEGTPQFPYVPGTDGAGEVMAVGSNVRRFKVGDRVYAIAFLSPKGGFYAEFTVVKEKHAARIPKGMKVEQAAALAALGDADLILSTGGVSVGEADHLGQVLREEGALEQACIGSELDSVGERLARVMPDACHFYPRDALTALVLSVRAGEQPPEDPRYTVLDMPLYFGDVRLVDEALLREVEARGKWINVWTVDDPEEMRRLAGEGVGGIMTDRPDLLRRVLDEHQKPR